jgi:hypothetical protein
MLLLPTARSSRAYHPTTPPHTRPWTATAPMNPPPVSAHHPSTGLNSGAYAGRYATQSHGCLSPGMQPGGVMGAKVVPDHCWSVAELVARPSSTRMNYRMS